MSYMWQTIVTKHILHLIVTKCQSVRAGICFVFYRVASADSRCGKEKLNI